MAEYYLKTPISEDEIRKVRVGDVIYLTGIVITARDAAHARALELLRKGEKLPVDFNGLAVYHCGPVVRKVDDGWEVVAAGPTTSMRMEVYEAEFIERTGVRVIIGKGGMGSKTAEACKAFGAVYAIFTGGAAALASRAMKRVIRVEWIDLGIPEALWVIEVENFGPLMVAIDSSGENFYERVSREIQRRLKEVVYPKIGL